MAGGVAAGALVAVAAFVVWPLANIWLMLKLPPAAVPQRAAVMPRPVAA